jgi:hypothetical protein
MFPGRFAAAPEFSPQQVASHSRDNAFMVRLSPITSVESVPDRFLSQSALCFIAGSRWRTDSDGAAARAQVTRWICGASGIRDNPEMERAAGPHSGIVLK